MEVAVKKISLSFSAIRLMSACIGMVLFLAVSFNGAGSRCHAAATANITVDFGQAVTVAPHGGILEGWTAEAPHDSLIKPIVSGGEYARMFSYEGRVGAAERGINLGYKFVARLDKFITLYGIYPYQNWEKWDSTVRWAARYWKHRAIYDVWNEPNLYEYWKGTKEQYFETYKRTYAILVEELGDSVQITGPSVATIGGPWESAWMKPFLDYCLANNLKVPVLNYHELTSSAGDQADVILSNLQNMYAKHINNPTYSALGIKKLLVLEAFWTENPGDILGEMYAFEKGKCDGAVNSCFGADCSVQTLSGLLVFNPQKNTPRSSWFVYKTYAQGVRSRVMGSTSSIRCPVIASSSISSDPSKAQVLYSYWNKTGEPLTADMTITLSNLDKAGAGISTSVKVTAERLVSSLNNASAGFVPSSTNVYQVTNGACTIVHSGVAENDIYRLVLESPSNTSNLFKPQIGVFRNVELTHTPNSITYTLAGAANVRLAIIDMSGRNIATLVENTRQSMGKQTIAWDERKLLPGLYFIRLQIDGKQEIVKMVVGW